ncbi:hypothetical protein [Pseudomonas tructae]|uniref:hypothetical protein n=1 Tax=Pseudomonas tructae TaxID=2518644 RepID=UPI0013EE71C1|nr:hypothetical protein [Pseudomonas tructae]
MFSDLFQPLLLVWAEHGARAVTPEVALQVFDEFLFPGIRGMESRSSQQGLELFDSVVQFFHGLACHGGYSRWEP